MPTILRQGKTKHERDKRDQAAHDIKTHCEHIKRERTRDEDKREERHSVTEPSIPLQPTPSIHNKTSEVETKLRIPTGGSSRDFTGRTPLSWAAAAGNEAPVKRLLDAGENIESSDKIYGWTPLLWAVAGGHEKTVELLLDRGASTTARGTNDQAPLSVAAWHGYGAVVALLLASGVDVNSADKDGRTALSWAMKNGHGDVVALLLAAAGTSLKLTDDYGRVPFLWSMKEDEKEDERSSEIIGREGSDILGNHSMDYDSLSSLSAVTHTEEASVTSMTSDNEVEGYDTASDTWTIDEGPCDNSDGLATDTRLTKPHEWLERLLLLEEEVSKALSTYCRYHGAQSLTHQWCLPKCLESLDNTCKSYDRLLDSQYCEEAVITAIADPKRPAVVNLQRILGTDLRKVRNDLARGRVEDCLYLLGIWGFQQTSAIIQAIPAESQLLALTNIAAKFLDLAVICFSGAQLEPFDLKYLGSEQPEIWICDTIVLHRRPLRCLGVYLHEQPIWVFEEVTPRNLALSQEPMYVTTTMKMLNDIWGPVWVTLTEQPEGEMPQQPWTVPVASYNIGQGWVIPCQQDSLQPSLANNEFLAHWTTDENDVGRSMPFPACDFEPHFVIGATTAELSVNSSCRLHWQQWRKLMGSLNRLHVPETRKPRRERESQMLTFSFSQFGLSAGYQEQYKIRAGSTLKDCIIAAWINAPTRRNPSIVADYLAVEISACSGNARRKRLARVLASSTIRNYLASIGHTWAPGAEQLYYDALGDRNIRTFEDLWRDRPDLRDCFGRAVAESLRALSSTGIDTDLCLSALWTPTPRRSWSALFPHSSFQWSGLLKDTTTSCTVAVVTNQCLIVNAKRCPKFGCQSPTSCKPAPTREPAKNRPKPETVFQTAMVVNHNASCPLPQVGTGGWDSLVLDKGAEFDLGDSGRLKVLGPVYRARGLLMKWSSPGVAAGAVQWLHEHVLKNGPRPYHREQVLDDWPGPSPIQIHVVS